MIINRILLTLLCILPLLFSNCKEETTSNPKTTDTKCTLTVAHLEKMTIYPSSHPINTDISGYPLDPNSAQIMNAIGSMGLHPDFGSGTYNGAPIGIPFTVVCGTQAKVPVVYRQNDYDGNYGDESDAGPFPIPLNAPIEGNGEGDSHVLTVDFDNGVLYELYNSSRSANGWEASSGAMFNLKNPTQRPAGWTSADASGMAILPLLVRYEEVKSGQIDHAIRFTLSKSKVLAGYVAPASHKVNGTGAEGYALPMGARLRLKASYDISTYPQEVQTILIAMKKYGIILADIGSDMFITGAPDERWDNDMLRSLKSVTADNFEVVELGAITK